MGGVESNDWSWMYWNVVEELPYFHPIYASRSVDLGEQEIYCAGGSGVEALEASMLYPSCGAAFPAELDSWDVRVFISFFLVVLFFSPPNRGDCFFSVYIMPTYLLYSMCCLFLWLHLDTTPISSGEMNLFVLQRSHTRFSIPNTGLVVYFSFLDL